MRGNLKMIQHFRTQHFARYSWYFRCLGCPLSGGFTVTLHNIKVVIFYYFEKEIYKVLKFHVNNLSFLELNASVF